MSFIVPIYTANIVLNIKKTGWSATAPEMFSTPYMVLKGFSPLDIIAKNKNAILKKAAEVKSLKSGQFFEIVKVNIIRQHGYGISEN